jgi:hypothetical protein
MKKNEKFFLKKISGEGDFYVSETRRDEPARKSKVLCFSDCLVLGTEGVKKKNFPVSKIFLYADL